MLQICLQCWVMGIDQHPTLDSLKLCSPTNPSPTISFLNYHNWRSPFTMHHWCHNAIFGQTIKLLLHNLLQRKWNRTGLLKNRFNIFLKKSICFKPLYDTMLTIKNRPVLFQKLLPKTIIYQKQVIPIKLDFHQPISS